MPVVQHFKNHGLENIETREKGKSGHQLSPWQSGSYISSVGMTAVRGSLEV